MTKTVVLVKPWGMHAKGATLNLAPPVADLLIQSGRAKAEEEPIREEPSKKAIRKQSWVK